MCKSANEQHGRELPMMNGIKEEIKTIGVMNPGSPDYQEALTNLLTRIKKLKVGFLIFQRVHVKILLPSLLDKDEFH